MFYGLFFFFFTVDVGFVFQILIDFLNWKGLWGWLILWMIPHGKRLTNLTKQRIMNVNSHISVFFFFLFVFGKFYSYPAMTAYYSNSKPKLARKHVPKSAFIQIPQLVVNHKYFVLCRDNMIAHHADKHRSFLELIKYDWTENNLKRPWQ